LEWVPQVEEQRLQLLQLLQSPSEQNLEKVGGRVSFAKEPNLAKLSVQGKVFKHLQQSHVTMVKRQQSQSLNEAIVS
jgi:hypothetical protein